MRFSEEQNCTLLQLYTEYECLWNVDSINYRNKNLRRAAEEEIVERFGRDGFGAVEFRQKIKNLRCTYHQECIKIQKSWKSNSASGYMPRIKWFLLMDNIIKRSKGNKNTEDSVDSAILLHGSPLTGTAGDGEETATNEDEAQNRLVGIASERLINKRSKNSKLKQMNKKVKMQQLVEADSSLQQADLNEHEAFGRYVSASLSKLSAYKAVLAQHEIQGILIRYRLGDISSCELNSRSVMYSPMDDHSYQPPPTPLFTTYNSKNSSATSSADAFPIGPEVVVEMTGQSVDYSGETSVVISANS